MLPREELETLVRGASDLGVALGSAQATKLLAFLDLLYRWNRTSRLTSVSRGDAVRIHLLDSLSAAPLLNPGIAGDLGSGAGLPGLPLAIARQDVRVELVESNRRRCSFLHEAVRELAISNAVVVEKDVDDLIEGGKTFATVISRAFRQPAEFLKLAHALLPVGGRAILMRGGRGDEGVVLPAELSRALERELERRFELPSGGESRSLVVFRRIA